ncbi:hypothetical protein NE555_16965, partial [Alistipes onderdonkii]|uniref:hypothetical protein n=1 Tax=Alistipes onderdonkii TaxID=328813 RepID=UPI00210E7733
ATPGAFFGHSADRRKYKQVALGLLDTDIDVLHGADQKGIGGGQLTAACSDETPGDFRLQ